MAELVAAFVASHAPLITANPESAEQGQKERIHDAMRRLHEELVAARPTALVICSNEHFTNFFYDNLPPFCVGVADGYQGPVETWLRVPQGRVPGQPELGQWLVKEALEHDFDLSFSHELRLDHGMMTVLHFLTPAMDVPVVPIIQNCAVKPMPTLRRCYQLGQELRRAVQAWDAPGERVALVGAGGLSHWVGLPQMGQLNEEFDRWFLQLMAEGRAAEALSLTEEQIETAGNGAHEIRSWLTIAGAMGDRPAEVLAYEGIQAWSTGMGAVTYGLAGAS
jgi:aromatic ring-opening dioxygenase catalytic subunit (LigB family)